MSEVSVEPDLRYLWAKTDRGSEGRWHPLLLHLLDVAASADAVLSREPESTRHRMAETLGLDWDSARPWLLFAIACHDLGKASPVFQAQWRGVLDQTALPMPRAISARAHHGFVSQLALIKLLGELGWQPDLADLTADAVACHHGHRASEGARDAAHFAMNEGNRVVSQAWESVRGAMANLIREILEPGEAPQKSALSGPDFMLVAGLTSFADWIGSNEKYFEFGRIADCDDPRAWFRSSRRKAAHALDEIGWTERRPLSSREVSFAEVFGRPPRPLQKTMEDVLRRLDRPAIILVEAPMGEGKTEAAFLAHLELQRRFGHRGMYVALPTMATGNAMFTRTREFLTRCGKDRKLDLQLLHAGKLLNDEFEKLATAQIYDDGSNGGVRAAEWFTNKKKALLSEYGVGTLDQALIPILPVRHNFVRLWGLANRVVVLDEIHAYDAYTGTLLQHLVEWLHALGSSVVLLSATLPPQVRNTIASLLGATQPSEIAPYPRIGIFRSGRKVEYHPVPPNPDRRLEIRIHRISPDLGIMHSALEGALPARGKGLALVNTVQRAQDLYCQFGSGASLFRNDVHVGKELPDGTQVLLFHARFPAGERHVREELVLETFGGAALRKGRCILIATQVAEQSLDLDFDVIATDLAPIDLIFQRAGRLWRHARTDRPVGQPLLFIAGLDGDQPPSFAQPLFWGKVYREDLLLRTWCALRERDVLRFPDEIDEGVRVVYSEFWDEPGSPDPGVLRIPEVLRTRLEEATIAAKGEEIAHHSQAHMAMIGFPDDMSWNDPSRFVLYDEDSPDVHRTLMAQTRIGQDSVLAVPIRANEPFESGAVPDKEKAKIWFLRSISLSRPEVVTRLRKVGVPPGWKESPLLRNCFSLLLADDNRWTELPTVRLDDELGIIYEKADQP